MRSAFVLLALVAAPTMAQEQTTEQRAAADAAMRARVERTMGASSFAGNYAVALGRRRVAGGSLGESAPGIPFVYEAVFPWASVTKQVIATMVMREVADRRIALDAPASRYLRELGNGGRSPTVRELLQHRSGLRNPDDSVPDAAGTPSFYTSGPTGIQWCLGARGTPGGPWRYNNCDYLLLGGILERVRQRPLAELLAARVLGPTGMRVRFAGSPADDAPDSAWAGGPTADERRMLTRYGSAGSLMGTAEDMLAFDAGLLSGALLPDRERAELWRGDPKLGHQALGQWSFTAPLKGCAAPVRIVERRGAIGRFQVRNLIAPDQGLSAVMLTNRGEEQLDFGEIWQGKGLGHDLLAAALCP
ncbi:MAG TPA: serine hydrolase domain-containing protein [Sphingomonas sp.]|jgi:D-alanyl-D-alanine carboxypeptidase|uniref:serine hydrolase domain-containing protein n=1 Tax=Sphingomonas sp. TaxID=28214 RepID=UPI002ED7C63A